MVKSPAAHGLPDPSQGWVLGVSPAFAVTLLRQEANILAPKALHRFSDKVRKRVFGFHRALELVLRVEENAVGFRFSLALSAVSSFVRV